jgi:hypothetical protein
MAVEKLWDKNNYDILLEQYNVPDSSKSVTVIKNRKPDKTGMIGNYIWVADNTLCFFPAWQPSKTVLIDENRFYSLFSIKLEDIEYFSQSGELYRENKISGGCGGGSDLSGAIVGGLLFGGAGAIVGSRKKIEGVKSELITHDKRETIISYIKDGHRKILTLAYSDFYALKDLIPNKDRNIVIEIEKNTIIDNSVKPNNMDIIADKIRIISKLKDDDFLTEEEFLLKKNELLKMI